jgi:hypothetical protein
MMKIPRSKISGGFGEIERKTEFLRLFRAPETAELSVRVSLAALQRLFQAMLRLYQRS